jgi:hypothetical protein
MRQTLKRGAQKHSNRIVSCIASGMTCLVDELAEQMWNVAFMHC